MASKQVIINLSTTNSFQKIKLDLDFPYIEKALLNSLKTIRREKKKRDSKDEGLGKGIP